MRGASLKTVSIHLWRWGRFRAFTRAAQRLAPIISDPKVAVTRIVNRFIKSDWN